MKKVSIFLIIATVWASSFLYAQKNFWDGANAYLGQPPPGDVPVKFAPALINDTPFFSMDRCAFSPDGKEYYYETNNTWFSSAKASLQTYKFDGAKWVGPKKVISHLYAPVFSTDGNTIYLIGGGRGAVSQIHRTDTGWSIPSVYLKRGYGVYDFVITNSGNMYAGSNVNGSINDFTCYDISMMPPAGTDTTIRTLGKPLNTPGFDGDFFIAPDESYIVISAKEHPDYECELYISYHKKDGRWTNPKSLGDKINNGLAHRWGEYVTPNNKYLFYSYGHGPQDCALYWVRFDDLLQQLKHTNFEPYVMDSIANQAVTAGKEMALQIPERTFIDDDGNNTLRLSATLSSGDALPAWLTFDARKKTLTGIPPSSGTYNIKVIATDPAQAKAECSFVLIVSQ